MINQYLVILSEADHSPIVICAVEEPILNLSKEPRESVLAKTAQPIFNHNTKAQPTQLPQTST